MRYTLHEDQYKFLIISHSVIFRTRNNTYKSCRENKNFYAKYLPEIRVLYEIMWKNTVLPGRPKMTIRCMSSACWIP